MAAIVTIASFILFGYLCTLIYKLIIKLVEGRKNEKNSSNNSSGSNT